MNALQPWHVILLVVAVVVIFGSKRLPGAARSIGQSMKIFKAETKDMKKDGGEDESNAEAAKTESTRAEEKQLPNSAATQQQAKSSDDQVAELQRQLDELKGSSNTSADSAPNKNAS